MLSFLVLVFSQFSLAAPEFPYGCYRVDYQSVHGGMYTNYFRISQFQKESFDQEEFVEEGTVKISYYIGREQPAHSTGRYYYRRVWTQSMWFEVSLETGRPGRIVNIELRGAYHPGLRGDIIDGRVRFNDQEKAPGFRGRKVESIFCQ